LSKQSNQRYRKEKEKEHMKKAGLEKNVTGTGSSNQSQDKIFREYDAPSDGFKR
jgi:hypothetical protein